MSQDPDATILESQKRAVMDLLEEYRAASRGMVSFEFIDPHEQTP